MTKDIAQRIMNAENSFIETVVSFGFTKEQGQHILTAYRLLKVVKLEVNIGRYTVKHGAFWDVEVLQKALRIELS